MARVHVGPSTIFRLGSLFLLLGIVAARKAATVDKPPKVQSCSSKKSSSAIAVSIVFAECQGNTVLAAESMAQAAVSGCGDAYAAGIGVSIAHMATTESDGMIRVMLDAFSGVLSFTQTVGDAAAVAQSVAIAFASQLPYEVSTTDLLYGIASSISDVADAAAPGGGCPRATKIAIAFYNGLLMAAPEMAPVFAVQVGMQVTQCKLLVKLATLAASDSLKTDAKLAKLVGRLAVGGVGRGRCKLPLFTPDVDGQVQSSSLAITIAEVTCPTTGNATVAAIAIATAAISDRSVASSAIAGVLAAGVDVTASFVQASKLPVDQRKAAVQAYAAAIVGLDLDAQNRLLANVAKALANIAANAGCDTAVAALGLIQATLDPATGLPAVSPAQMKPLCNAVASYSCSTACTAVVGR